MPATPEGVYADKGGQWYFKVTLGRDPLTGRREQVTRRGFRTASEAARARRELLERKDRGQVKVASGGTLTVNDLLDLYLDGLDADERLSPKTRHDYRIFADTYLRGLIGKKKVRDVTPEVVLTWQRRLLKEGSPTGGRPLSPNTIRLARSPLAGAFKLALKAGIVSVNPVAQTPQPKARRSVPKHWSPVMLANGVAPKVAAERLGHSDPSLFLNLYSHVTPTMQREADEKIGAALFGER
jgi:hypothetical protein